MTASRLTLWISTLALCLALFCNPRQAHAEYGLYFGGPGGSVDVPNFKLPDDAQAFAVELRFRTDANIRQSFELVSQWSADPRAEDKGGFFIGLKPPMQIAMGLRNSKGIVKQIAGNGSWRDGQWHHLAAVWDGEEAIVYLDGKAVAQQKISDFGAPAVSQLPLVIGPVTDPKSRRPAIFDGFISDVAVWTTAPQAEALSARLAQPLSGHEPGLAAYFPMRGDAPAATLKDKTAAGREGRLSESLARIGWCATPIWHEAEPNRPHVNLFGYDLSAPAKAVEGQPTVDAGIDQAARQILISNEKTGQAGVLWQDKAFNAIYVTWIDTALEYHHTIRLAGLEDGTLAAGTTDSKGDLYYLVIQKSPPNRPETTALEAKIYHANAEGKALRDAPVDMTPAGFNVYNYGGRWGGSMVYQKGLLGLILPRTMYMSGDGLRHQGAIAVAIAVKDLSVVKNFGQTSGHSFGNVLSVNTRGEFLAVDLGDNYPRGVHLHKFTHANRVSRVVFTFKTAHGTSARNGSPVYDEISGNGKTFYKWSNDNGTYTELGGAVEGQKTYSVIFSTDRSTEGKVLDNSRAFNNSGDPRDLAMLRIIKDFEKAPGGNEVNDALMAGIPKGATTETGGFFNFGGGWTKQRITGVIWLTQYAAGEAAHAPHAVRLRDGNILILWEKAKGKASSLHAMVVQESGKIVTEPMDLGLALQLNREDPVLQIADKLCFIAREGGRTQLRVIYDP